MKWVLLLLCLALPGAPYFLPPFAITLGNYIGIYGITTLGLVLLTGIGGLTSFGQAAFVGIAAYTTGWLTATQGFSPWLGLIAAVAITGIVAFAVGLVTLRLEGHYLALSTIAWGIAIYSLFGSMDALGRYNGLPGIPPIEIGSISFAPSNRMFYLIWAIFIALMLFVHNLLDSREGRAVRSLRGGGLLIEAFGARLFRTRLAVFVIAAIFAALSGWLYAHMSRFVSPAPFDIRQSIEYLFMAMVGGATTVLGAAIGAALVTVVKSWLQDILPLFSSNAAQFETVAFAIAFVLLMHYARTGIASFAPTNNKRKAGDRKADVKELPRRSYPPAGTQILVASQITKRFGGLVAVNDVSFSIEAGEIVGLIGPNGAGKTTLLNLITGALFPDSGSIHCLGQDITRLDQCQLAEIGISRTFQHVKLRPNMSAIDSAALGTYLRTSSGYLRAMLRLNKAEEDQARHEALKQLDRVGLGEKAFFRAGSLPLGNQRILEVARALAADPVLIVLDEPCAGLRHLEKQALVKTLKALKAEGLTTLLVEHDMGFVMEVADRLIVMDFGSKLVEGAPAAIRRDPRVQEAYLGGVAA